MNIDLQSLHFYLFGGVKFLDLLLLAMAVDIFFGVLKAIKQKKLGSKTAWLGYARKVGTFGIVIVANIIDVILQLKGMVAFATVLFYIVAEIVSIIENCAELNMRIPKLLLSKVKELEGSENKEIRFQIEEKEGSEDK